MHFSRFLVLLWKLLYKPKTGNWKTQFSNWKSWKTTNGLISLIITTSCVSPILSMMMNTLSPFLKISWKWLKKITRQNKMKTLWYVVLVLYVHSLAREVVNVHVEIHRHVVFSTRLIWQAAEVPQGWNVPIVVWHFPHLFCSSGVCLAHLHPMHIHTGDKNSVKSHKFMNLCVLTEFLQPRRILIRQEKSNKILCFVTECLHLQIAKL